MNSLWSIALLLGPDSRLVMPDRLQNGLDNLVSFHENGERFFFLGAADDSNWYSSQKWEFIVIVPPTRANVFDPAKAFVHPNRNDTFPLQGLEDYLVASWQNWRHTLSQIGWDTILLLGGESVEAAVKGGASVTVENLPPFIITAQEKLFLCRLEDFQTKRKLRSFRTDFVFDGTCGSRR